MQTQALIIGGGATGTAVARDLALRGVQCILVEKDDLNAGASGGNHGLLHSGARYVSNDHDAAVECREEGHIIKGMMPQLVEAAGGLFVAVQGDDEKFPADFPGYCNSCGVPCQPIDVKEARELEPILSDKLIAAFRVEDGSIDPFKLCLEHTAHAITLGSKLMRRTKLVAFRIENRRIVSATLRDTDTGAETTVEPDLVINASGAWAAQVAALAGAEIRLLYSKGTLLITNDRLNTRIINRCRKPSDADILVPGGTVSILGTTSTRIEDPDAVYPTVEESELIVRQGAQMVPQLARARYIRAFCGVRPLVLAGEASDARNVSRGFSLVDHEKDNIDNFITITGGKLTTFRLMAEKTSDLAAKKLGVNVPCKTRELPLPSPDECEWTEPGRSPKHWMQSHDLRDTLLCECEMVSKRAVDAIVRSVKNNNERPRVTDIGFRSRLGRGTCQGAFCGPRTINHLYDTNELTGAQGLADMEEFFQERWKGVHSICWGDQIVQAELMEAIHCGLFSEELYSK